jgi:hypothetical protein
VVEAADLVNNRVGGLCRTSSRKPNHDDIDAVLAEAAVNAVGTWK